MTNYTPVALITYNRPWHTKQVLRSLQEHKIKNLYIFSDGPKSDKDIESVYETRSLIYKINWTNPVIIERRKNFGLARSVISATEEILRKHGKIILLEDDCVPQPYFFSFMEDCLNKYEKDEKVFGISGYTVPVNDNILANYPYDIYFSPRIGSWGWGTWHSSWRFMKHNLKSAFWEAICQGVNLAQGGNDVPLMLRDMLSGKLQDVWTLNWILSVYLHNGCYVYPTRSHIKNIGMDGSGVHCGKTTKYNEIYANRRAEKFPDRVVFNRPILDNFKQYYDIPGLKAFEAHSDRKKLKVVHLAVQDFGGAGRAAYRLHKGLQDIADSSMMVLNKISDDPTVKIVEIDPNGNYSISKKSGPYISPLFKKQYVKWQKNLEHYPRRPPGLEMFSDPESSLDLGRIDEIQEADIINLHWVAGYADFTRSIPALEGKPVVWTLHDMNPFTGGCHYAGKCRKYHNKCGSCPQLGSDMKSDLARKNWNKKVQAYRSIDLTVVGPSRWLADCAKKSALFANQQIKNIPYGLPINIYRPRTKSVIREELSIPEKSFVILFGADDISNKRKGLAHVIAALKILYRRGIRDLILMTFGNKPKDLELSVHFPIYHLGYVRNENQLSIAYNAADVFVIPSLEDNLPNTPIEAAACGLPVVGFRVGGISDIVNHLETGYLAELENTEDFAQGIAWVKNQVSSGIRFTEVCQSRAVEKYAPEKQANAYLQLYQTLLARRGGRKKNSSRAGQNNANSHSVEGSETRHAEAVLLARQGNFDQAIVELEKTVKLYPCDAKALNDLGVLYYQTGDFERATRAYRKAMDIEPNNTTYIKNLADLLSVEYGRFEEALELYNSALAYDPVDTEVLIALAHICSHMDQTEDALDFLRRAQQAEPSLEGVAERIVRLENQIGSTSNRCHPKEILNEADTPIVSAIVSVYNAERYLRGCLDSLLQQTIADRAEIIVVNSGSEENEELIVKQYQEKYPNIKYVRTETRETVYKAWNRAIKISSGKYITSANTDDRHRKDAFEIMVRTLDENPDISLVYADVLITETENEVFDDCNPVGIYRWLDWDREKLLYRGCFMGPQPMWRRDVHSEYGYFDESYVTSGDYEFWLRISQTRKFYHIPDTLGLYLKTPNSIEHRNRERQCVENRKILETYQKAYCQNRVINMYESKDFIEYDSPEKEGCLRDDRELYITFSEEKQYPTYSKDDAKKPFEFQSNQEATNSAYFSKSRLFEEVVADYLKTADILFQKELIDEGIDTLLKAIGPDPQDGRLYIALAEHLINHGRHQQALEALAEMPEGLSEEILDKKALLEAYAQVGLGEIEEAGKIADEIGDSNQNDGRLLNLRGILAYHRGDKIDAESLFRQAIEADADYGEPHTNLGSLYLEKGEPGQAMECFQKGFSLSPTDLDVANLYHEAVTAAGDFAGAEKLVVKLLKKFPDNRKLRYLLIDVQIQQGKVESALEQMQQAVAVLGTGQGLLDTALNLQDKANSPQKADNTRKSSGVSLCMIVKDEEAHLARCLASVKPIVDEMIVVDTGSQDRTKDVASLFGAKVYDFEWSGDFAAARNFSISKATRGWILVMDADEVISAMDYDKFRKLVRKRPKKPVAYGITTRNYCNLANTIGWEANRGEYPDEEAGWGWLPSTKVRLFVRDKRIRFEGAVHEMVDFVVKRAGITVKGCNIPVHHYGRLDAERLDRKGEIYYEIGRRKLEDTGNDIAAVRELAVQATILGRNEEALDLWSRFLAMEPPPKAAAEANVNLATLYLRLKSYEEAERASETALALAPDMKEALYNVALSRIHLGRARSAFEILEQLVEAHEDYAPAQFMRAAACFILGNKVRGQNLLRDLRQGPLGRLLAQSFGELVRDLEAAGQTDYSRGVLAAALENDIIDPRMVSVLGGHAAAEASAAAANG